MLTEQQRYRIEPRVKRVLLFYGCFPLASIAFAVAVGVATGGLIDFDQISLMSLLGILTGLLMFLISLLLPLLLLPTPTLLAAQLVQQHQTTDVSENQILDMLTGDQLLRYSLFGILITGGVFLNLVTFFVEQCGAAAIVAALGILLQLAGTPWPRVQFRRLAKTVSQIQRELQLIRIE